MKENSLKFFFKRVGKLAVEMLLKEDEIHICNLVQEQKEDRQNNSIKIPIGYVV